MSRALDETTREAEDHDGIIWQRCTKHPLLALGGFFLLIICMWLPFYLAAPILPIVLETDFEKYLSSNEPAFTEYEEVTELEKLYISNAYDLDSKFHNYRQLQSIPIFNEKVEIIYLCVSESCDTIFTESNLERIKNFERKLEANFYSKYCELAAEGTCKEAVSILNFFYPSIVNGDLRRFDGNGDELVSIQSALEALKVAGELWFASRKFLSSNGKSLVARSQFAFNTIDEASYRSLCKDGLLDFLNDEQDQGDFEILWYGKVLNEAEIEKVVISDSMLAIASLLIVFFIMWSQSRSLFLTTVSVLCTLLCYPATYVVYRFFAGIEVMMIFNFTSIFVLIGIGADNFFIFSDLWTQSKGLQGFTVAQRLSWTFQKAAGATLITTMTTAASFLANLASPIEPVRSFGFFMGTIVIFLYLHMVVAIPLALAAHDKHFLNLCANKNLSLPKRFLTRRNSQNTLEYEASALPVATSVELDTDDVQVFLPEEEEIINKEAAQAIAVSRSGFQLKKVSSSQLFGSSNNIKLQMEESSQDLDKSYPFVVRVFHGKIGPFVYRYRYILALVILSLIIGLGAATINQVEVSDSVPEIFSKSTNLGKLFDIRKEYFSDKLSAPDYTGDIESNICYDLEGKVVFCSAAPTFAPTEQVPTYEPTGKPTLPPSTGTPTTTTNTPTDAPITSVPSSAPTSNPTPQVTVTTMPTNSPTLFPTAKPTYHPTTPKPTDAPTSQQPTHSPSEAPSKSPTLSPTPSPVSPYVSSISLLDRNTGQTLALTPSFDQTVFFYNIDSGKTHPRDVRITADPITPRVQVHIESISESEYDVFINPAIKYRLKFTFEEPLQCDCHGNGVCADEATRETAICKCYNGWTIESNCSQVDPTIDRLGDSNVLEVQISWLRSRGINSFADLQTEMVEMCNKIDSFAKSFEENKLQVRRVKDCIIREMWEKLDGTIYLDRLVNFPLNVTEEDFARALQYYITRYNPGHRKMVLFNDDLQIVSLSLTVLTNIDNLAGAVEADVYYKRWKEFIHSQDSNAIQTSLLWARTQTEIAIVSGTKTSAIISIMCAFLAILIFSRLNWILTIVTTFSIASVIILLLSTMVVMQHRKIGAIESLSCIILLGMAVDYSTHLAHTFNHSKCNTLEARTRHTLGQTGISILFGALTTSGAAFPLLFTSITLFQDFGMFVIINMIYSLLLAVFFLVPCLVVAYTIWDKVSQSPTWQSVQARFRRE